MFIPPLFKLEDRDEILGLMRTYSFATLVTDGENGLFATHLPVVVEREEPLVLAGHVSAANAQKLDLASGKEAMLLFQGPHQYISPAWYQTSPNVPTWNYMAVHAYGRPEIVAAPAEVERHLVALANFIDPELKTQKPESLEPEFLHRMFRGLVAFRLTVTRLEAKAKLNQNKSPEDREAVVDRLSESLLDTDAVLAAAMRRLT